MDWRGLLVLAICAVALSGCHSALPPAAPIVTRMAVPDENAPKPLTAQAPLPPGYALVQVVDLKQGDKPAGTLELIEDARLTPQRRERLWGRVIDGLGTPLATDIEQPLKQDLAPARLRLVRTKGSVTAETTLPTPMAGMEPVHLYGDDVETYLITQDRSSRVSSRLVTVPMEIVRERFERLTVTEAATHQTMPWELPATRRSAWRLVPARDSDGKEIESIACRLGSPGNELTLASAVFDGKLWLRTAQNKPGCWEDDQDFPPQPEFP